MNIGKLKKLLEEATGWEVKLSDRDDEGYYELQAIDVESGASFGMWWSPDDSEEVCWSEGCTLVNGEHDSYTSGNDEVWYGLERAKEYAEE